MKRLSRQGIIKDERAQALTEFVIVIPAVLLIFLLIIQYFLIVQASILGNYAAYAAARVYAVRTSWDSNAEDLAQRAAALVYAPLSVLAPGEVISGVGGSLAGELTDVLPGIVGDIAQLAEGYAVARYVRMNSSATGGDIKISKGGSPSAVTVHLHYGYPIMIPGLKELWTLTGGNKSITADLKPLSDGFGGTIVCAKYPYIDIQSKCLMGIEEWSGTPRKRKSVSSGAETDPELAAKEKAMKEAEAECKEAFDKMNKEQKEYGAAKVKYDEAKEEYDRLMADPTATDEERGEAYQKQWEAYLEMQSEKSDYDQARWRYEQKKKAVEDATGQDFTNPPPEP